MVVILVVNTAWLWCYCSQWCFVVGDFGNGVVGYNKYIPRRRARDRERQEGYRGVTGAGDWSLFEGRTEVFWFC